MKPTLVSLILAISAAAQPPDLRGIWMAQGKLNTNIEGATGKLPYQAGALAQRQKNSANRAASDPETKCFQPGVPRAPYLPYPFQIFQNAQGVYIVYQRVHAYRVIYLDSSPHREGLGYAMGDSRGRWEGNNER